MCSHGPSGRFKDSQKPLRAIYRNYLALIRPIFRIIDQRSTHRILSNVLPFFAHTFITAQDVTQRKQHVFDLMLVTIGVDMYKRSQSKQVDRSAETLR